MKVGFFLDNANYAHFDFSFPGKGNPGIRGTQYMIWTIACFLNSRYSDVETVLFAPVVDTMPPGQPCLRCQSEEEALAAAKRLSLDILVFRTRPQPPAFYAKLGDAGIKCVTWSHNFEDFDQAQAIASSPWIKRNVCVGKQQYDRLRDHPVFAKSTWIFNSIDFENYHECSRAPKRHIVCYVGTLYVAKGFHMLAKAWKRVRQAVPDAELLVLGAGIPNASGKMGKYGLASPSYEKRFAPYLLGPDGHWLPGVRFLGNLGGDEKKRVMAESAVGVANPTGKDETFCIAAIEFQALGVPVVSARKNGLLDTVVDGETGLLISNTRQLASAIVELLLQPEKASRLGQKGDRFVREKFGMDQVCARWRELLLDVCEDKSPVPTLDCSHLGNQAKWLREWNRRLQGRGIRTPSVLFFESAAKTMAKKLLRRSPPAPIS